MYFNTNLIKAHGIVHIFKLFKKILCSYNILELQKK